MSTSYISFHVPVMQFRNIFEDLFDSLACKGFDTDSKYMCLYTNFEAERDNIWSIKNI